MNSALSEIKSYVEDVYLKNNATKVAIEVYGVEHRHTGDFLPTLRQKIKLDFVVMPCDFITDVQPQVLIDTHRNRDSKTVLTGVYYKNNIETIDKKSIQADFMIHKPLRQRNPILLDCYARQEVRDRKGLRARQVMLVRHPNLAISTNLLQSSIYFCSKEVFNVLSTSEDDNGVQYKDRTWTKVIRDIARRSWQHREPLETVAFHVIDSESTLIRVDNLSAYLEANRWIMKQHLRTRAHTAPKPAPVKGAATVGADSLVGPNGNLGEKTSVKKSNIGANCTLGKRCRITGCVILDGVTIADDVVLENCLIGRDAKVHTKVRLTSCTVEGGYVISKDSQAKNEVFEQLTMGDIGDEDFGIYESSESDSESEESEEDENYEEDEGDYSDDGLFDRS